MKAIFSNRLRNLLVDWYWRGQTYVPPATHYFGLLTSTTGPRANSTAYALNATFSVVATDGTTHLYKCTTAGTSAATVGLIYEGEEGEVVTDGTAVMTEQTPALRAGTAAVEPLSGRGYARVSRASSLVNFSGTQTAGSTTASTGTSGITSNNASVVFGTPTADWRYCWALADFDAATAGNLLSVHPLTTPFSAVNGDLAPGVPMAKFETSFDL